MFSVFLVTLLAHLIGDFLLQNNFFMKAKSKSPLGAFLHTLIVIISTSILIILAFGNSSWPLIVIVSVAHLLIDMLKPILLRKVKYTSAAYFLIDQTLHFATLLISANIGKNNIVELDENKLFIVSVLTMIILSAMFVSLCNKLILMSIFPGFYKKRPLFEMGEHGIDAIYGLSIFVALFAVPFWYLSIPVIMIFTGIFFFASTTYSQIPIPSVIIKIVLSLIFVISFKMLIFV